MAKKKDAGKNYLDFVPVRNPAFDFTVADDGIVTITVEWQGFYHRIAQRVFRRPRVSDIKLDAYGSFVWQAIDGEKNVYTLSQELEAHFGEMDKALSRLIKFLEIMHDHKIISWKEEGQ